MRIQNNITAMNSYRNYSVNNANQAKSSEKLASGYRINSAKDDAAGLAISEKMRAQIRGLDTASKNAQDGISLVQTAEGALQEVHSMLQRMNELAVQSSTGTSEDFDRDASAAEFNQLKSEIDDIAKQTTFNNMKLFDGSLGSGKITVNSTMSTLAVGKQAGDLYMDKQSGITSVKEGTYTFSQGTITGGNFTANTTGTDLRIKFTDVDGNITNTDVAFSDVYSSKGGALDTFTLDLSAAGLGKFEGRLAAASTAAQSLDDLESVTSTVRTYTSTGVFGTAGAGLAAGATWSGITAEGTFDTSSSGDDFIISKDGVEVTRLDLTALVDENTTHTYDLSDFGLGTLKFTTGATDPVVPATIATNLAAIGSITNSGSTDGELKIQVGALAGEQLGVNIAKMDSSALGVKTLDISNQVSAGAAITATRTAINTVSEQRSALGALANRLQYRMNSLEVSSENLSSAESRIRDVDMAKEMTNFTKQGILSQASQAMLAQANSAPQNVLQLLRG